VATIGDAEGAPVLGHRAGEPGSRLPPGDFRNRLPSAHPRLMLVPSRLMLVPCAYAVQAWTNTGVPSATWVVAVWVNDESRRLPEGNLA
jgi:hypothetical protein